MKKAMILIGFITMLLLSCILSANAEQSGKCGDNAYWTLDDNGTLTIYGNGNMYDYSGYYTNQPPYPKDEVHKVIVQDGITTIGKSAFEGFSSLISVTLPEGLTNIGSNAFYKCIALTNIQLPNTLKNIEDHAFYSTSLKSITIPPKISIIKEATFEYSKQLTSVVLPDGLLSIETDAFWGCNKLTSINIPESVVAIDDMAFSKVFSKNLVLEVFEDSVGLEYAINEKINYVIISNKSNLSGDVTNDGAVDIMDVIRLLKYVSGWNVEINTSVSDVTGDGDINIMDVIRLLKYVSGWQVTLQLAFVIPNDRPGFTLKRSFVFHIISR